MTKTTHTATVEHAAREYEQALGELDAARAEARERTAAAKRCLKALRIATRTAGTAGTAAGHEQPGLQL